MSGQLTLVRTVASALGGAHSEVEVAHAVLTAVADHLRAATASLWLITADETEMVLAYERNAAADAVARFGRIPMDDALPGPYVVRTREPAFIGSRAERDSTWPQLAGTSTVSEALAVMPLLAPSGIIGVVSFGFPEVRDFDAEDRLTLMAVADQCAVALDRSRLVQALQADSEAHDLLARVSAAGGGSDWQATAQRIVQICVDALVDSCAIYLREGSMVRRIAMASRTYPAIAAELVDRFPTAIGAASANAVAIRTGEPVRLTGDEPEGPRLASPSAQYQELVRDVVFGDGWVLPLEERGRTFGAMLFAALPTDGPIPDDVVSLARHVASRAATVLRSAEEFSQHREALDAIHAVLLPGAIPRIDGLDVAACYQPVASRPNVGGDWWDVVALPDGRVALSIGDVAGHGIAPVGLMGQLRTAARSHLVTGRTPGETLQAMSVLLDWTAPTAHATAIVLIMDLAANSLVSAVAGHPPPLVVLPGQAPLVLESVPAPPLGVRPQRCEYPDVTTELPAGATLVLYTDGLIEDRHRSLDDGLSQLVELLATPAPGSLDDQCARVVAEMVDTPEDDVCLVLARRTDAFARTDLDADAGATSVARAFVADQLQRWHLDHLSNDACLVVSELVTNAVMHAQAHSSLVLRRTTGGVRIEVTDDGPGTPELQAPSMHSERGRGLRVVAAVSAVWGVDAAAGTKTVWAEITAGAASA